MKNKDITICRLLQAIEDFKAYDKERKKYYKDKMQELGALQSELQEIKENKRLLSDIGSLRILRDKAAKYDLLILSKECPEDFTLTNDTAQLVSKFQSMRQQISNLNAKNKKLKIENQRLVYQLTQEQLQNPQQ